VDGKFVVAALGKEAALARKSSATVKHYCGEPEGIQLQAVRKYLHTKLVYRFDDKGEVQMGSLQQYTDNDELRALLVALAKDTEARVFRLTPLA
jgi:hypothetical protein